MYNNLHIVMNSFGHASRILKETATLIASGFVDNVYIAALHEDGVEEHEEIDARRFARRFKLITRAWPRNIIVQTLKYLEFCVRVIFYVRKKEIKLVNIHHLDLLPLGVFLKWMLGAKLVYDAHELETERYGLAGTRKKIARCVERFFVHRADLMIVVGESIEQWYRDKYGALNIVTVMNCPGHQNIKRTQLLRQNLGIPPEKKILLYQGGLHKSYGAHTLLKVFSEYNDNRHVIVFMGYGELEPLIQQYTKLYDNIYFKEAVRPNEILQWTSSADIGVSYIDNPSLNDRFCLPNKLFEYIMAGLPVIVNNSPDQARLVLEKDIGVVLEELTPQSLAGALEMIDEKDGFALSENLKQTAKHYSWNTQAERMMTAYKQHVFSCGG